ncbi:hypothetical protein [Rhizobium multihospitium]|uniref:Uncharacterized protein n=1 Tax=Rhizobium multihospitium TaxID=410764 RepID=A0A1C3WP35_9HYPH|nr:hypothetical protein [Rhizobium multihospitium]SCB41678.1 hypothetical protein GA0061103_5894 [Rhizobium multihospitium]
MGKPQRPAIKAQRKPRKRTASRPALPAWIYFVAIIATPVTIEFFIPRHWAHFPWIVGPIAWLVTIVAAISFLWSLITLKGLTIGSAGSCMALAAFIVAGTVYLLAPPIAFVLTLLVSQVAATIIFIMLMFILRRIQIALDPLHHQEIRPPILNLATGREWLRRALPGLVLWDGLTLIFLQTGCKDLTIATDVRRCMDGEVLMGIHGPFSNIYYAAYFGMMAFVSPVMAILQTLWRLAKRSDDNNEMSL